MNKKSIVAIVVIAIILIGGFASYKLYYKMQAEKLAAAQNPKPQVNKKTAGPQVVASVKGTKLAENEMLNKHFYLIHPVTGEYPDETKQALSGWLVTKANNSDGAVIVTLTPQNTEQEDHKQEFTVKPGEKLYFVELNLNDDVNGQDEKWFDDLGILTDANGVILNDLPKPPGK